MRVPRFLEIRRDDILAGIPQAIERTTLRRIVSLLRPHARTLLAVLVLLVSSALLNLLPPLFLKHLIDEAIPTRDVMLFGSLCLGMLVAPAAADFLDVAEKYLTTLVGERVTFTLRTDVYRHLHRQPLGYFTAARPGQALSSVLNDVQGVGSVVSERVMDVAQNITIVVATFAMLFMLEWRFAVAAVLALPLFAFPARRIARRKKQIKRAIQAKIADFVGTLAETLSVSGALLLKIFGAEERESARVEERARELMNLSLRQALIGRWFRLLLDLLENAGPVFLWAWGGYLVMGGDVKLGTVVASVALMKKLYAPATALANVYVELVSSYAYLDRIFGVLDLEPAIVDAPDAEPLDDVRGALCFKDVSFSYGRDAHVLRNFDLDVREGQCVALVGPSGAGKSTIAALIARLYDPTEGTILLDGHDLRRVQLKSLRGSIGIVSQDTFLLHGTILENIRFGRPDANNEQIVAAARAAQLHEFISTLPEGYDTVVGDRGFRLSGGERQRVAIARAILRDPAILILDEATSALDSQNESMVQAALAPLFRGRTTLVIAHRLSTVRNADLIVVIDQGRIVERGSHDDLLANAGLYAQLHRQQAESAANGDRAGAAA